MLQQYDAVEQKITALMAKFGDEDDKEMQHVLAVEIAVLAIERKLLEDEMALRYFNKVSRSYKRNLL